MQSALNIKKSFPKDYVILERAKKERPKEGLEALPLQQLIEKIKVSEDKNEIQNFTQDPRKTVRETATKRLNELLIGDNE